MDTLGVESACEFFGLGSPARILVEGLGFTNLVRVEGMDESQVLQLQVLTDLDKLNRWLLSAIKNEDRSVQLWRVSGDPEKRFCGDLVHPQVTFKGQTFLFVSFGYGEKGTPRFEIIKSKGREAKVAYLTVEEIAHLAGRISPKRQYVWIKRWRFIPWRVPSTA